MAGLIPVRFRRRSRPAWASVGALFTATAFAQSPAPDLRSAAPDLTLPTVTVKGKPEPAPYQGGTTTAGKTEQAPRDVPQSLTIITGDLIRDRGADTVKEALRNAAGITFNAGEGGRNGDNVTIRGYSIVGDLYLDGIRDIAQYNRETFNLQQIDVLRGSSSMLYGRGSTGGIVNQVSKVPLLREQGEAALTLGSYDYRRTTVDVNHVLGDASAVRLNAMYTDANSFRNGVESNRWGVAPAVSWGVGADHRIDLAYYHLKEDNVPDYGVPYFRGRPLAVPVERFFGLADADYERYETGIATARWTWRHDSLEWRTTLRYGEYRRDLWPSAPRLGGNPSIITDDGIVTRSRPGRDGIDKDTTLQSDASYAFSTGSLWHELLAGVELAHEDSHTRRWTNAAGTIPTTTVGHPDTTPALPAGFFEHANATVTDFTSDTVGLYAQDTIEFLPHWKIVAGLRYDDFAADYRRAEPLGPLSRTDRVWSYRSGLLWQPTDQQSYYVAYGTSFNPSGELYALDPRSSNTPPEKNRNLEAGAKWELLDGGLSLRAAVFRSEKTNERNTDPLVTDVFLLSGRRHTDGVEIEAAGRLTPRWEVFGGVAWLRGRITESLNAGDVGKWPINTPPYTANLWTTYALTPHWKIGGGFEAVGRRYTSTANTTQLPAYTRWDGLVEWADGPWTVRLNAYNVLDETYYEGLYTGHAVPGTARSFHVTGIYRF